MVLLLLSVLILSLGLISSALAIADKHNMQDKNNIFVIFMFYNA
jgi:hypothetical protein